MSDTVQIELIRNVAVAIPAILAAYFSFRAAIHAREALHQSVQNAVKGETNSATVLEKVKEVKDSSEKAYKEANDLNVKIANLQEQNLKANASKK